MKVNDIALEDLRVGDKCISEIGNFGTITYIDSTLDDGTHRGWIEFNWSSGNTTVGPYELRGCPWIGEFIEYLGHS